MEPKRKFIKQVESEVKRNESTQILFLHANKGL